MFWLCYNFKQKGLGVTRYYAGIGSRKSPSAVMSLMTTLAQRLATQGYVLRSGAADGADKAFELGCDIAAGEKEIWLPWEGYNGHVNTGLFPTDAHFKKARTVHPVWNSLSEKEKKLHARNMGQILGMDLSTPVEFVACWTNDSCESDAERSIVTGGTGSAISLASLAGIPVFNLARTDALSRLTDFVLAQCRKYHVDGTQPEVSAATVFVFGSNLAGRHGAGAAKAARDTFGAELGEGVGPTGSSYAIPTKDAALGVLPLEVIQAHVEEFITFAKANRSQEFFVTRIACGYAGYSDSEIAPLFRHAPANCSFAEEWRPWLGPRLPVKDPEQTSLWAD